MTIAVTAAEISHRPLGTATGQVIAWVGAGIILLMLGRVVHDRAFRYLAACLVAFALNRVLSSIDGKPELLVLLTNLLTVASALCQVCFFRIVLGEAIRHRIPRLRAEYIVAIAVAAVAIGAWWLAPPESRDGSLAGPSYAHDNAAFTFVMVLIGYYAVVGVRVVNWTWQLVVAWIRQRAEKFGAKHQRTDPSHDSGQIVARLAFHVGVLIVGLAEVTRLASNISKLTNELLSRVEPNFLLLAEKFSPVITTGVRIGHTMFYVGVILPLVVGSVVAAQISVRQSLDCRRLKCLWAAMTGEFTDLAYRGARGIGGKVYRREVEIRDGLVLLENYYDPIVAGRAMQQGADEIVATVAVVRAALRAHKVGAPVANPTQIPTSGATSRTEDVAWLLRVADEFATAEKVEGRFIEAQSH